MTRWLTTVGRIRSHTNQIRSLRTQNFFIMVWSVARHLGYDETCLIHVCSAGDVLALNICKLEKALGERMYLRQGKAICQVASPSSLC